MTNTITPYRSDLPVGRDGFAQLVHAEWTKFRTVRGWVIGSVAAAVVLVLIGVLAGAGSHTESCIENRCTAGGPAIPRGPGGELVTDQFSFVQQRMGLHGTVTVRVDSLTGEILPAGEPAPGSGTSPSGSSSSAATQSGLQPWAKAGIIIKQATTEGSAYAAIMVTGAHGVRMQDNYTHDTPGTPGAVSAASPRWLRLTRSGTSITGYDSTDGTHWTQVGTAHLTGLPTTVAAGLFVTSPPYQQVSKHLGGSSAQARDTLATATFDDVSLQGGTPTGTWHFAPGTAVVPGSHAGDFQQAGGTFSVSGSGDIAPDVMDGLPVEHSLAGAFVALIIVIVLATLFITGEYRRRLIHTTLAASPRRGRVLAAKAVVIASITFVAGLVGAALAVLLGERLLRNNGNVIDPLSSLTELRVIAGTAALLAVAAVLALAVGTLLRRSAGAVAAVIVLLVLPYFLSVAFVLPTGAAQWVLRLTPAAGFAIQQSVTQYSQVSYDYSPANGYFPLAPWTGLAVLCAYTALAMGAAVYVLRRRDA